MIDYRELMVGNNIYFQWGALPSDIRVDTVVSVIEGAFENHFPISITEDVLLKCGFVNGRMKLCHNRFLQWNYGYDFCIENGIEDYLYEIENVKNLHQLQNLYFALTNQELIYTP